MIHRRGVPLLLGALLTLAAGCHHTPKRAAPPPCLRCEQIQVGWDLLRDGQFERAADSMVTLATAQPLDDAEARLANSVQHAAQGMLAVEAGNLEAAQEALEEVAEPSLNAMLREAMQAPGAQASPIAAVASTGTPVTIVRTVPVVVRPRGELLSGGPVR